MAPPATRLLGGGGGAKSEKNLKLSHLAALIFAQLSAQLYFPFFLDLRAGFFARRFLGASASSSWLPSSANSRAP